MLGRRGFLGAMLAACTAPAFVRPTSLMPLWLPQQGILDGEFLAIYSVESVEAIVRASLVRAMSEVIDQHLLSYGLPLELTLELQHQLKLNA